MKDLIEYPADVTPKRTVTRKKKNTATPPAKGGHEGDGFIFRDGRGLSYRVEWNGRESWLFARRRSGHWMSLRPVVEEAEIEAMMELEVDAHDYPLYDYAVEEIGRMFFFVRSVSRPEIVHVVDWESNVFGESPACSCEQNRFRKLPCKHLEAVRIYLGK